MKPILLLLLLIAFHCADAQTQAPNSIFLRVYDSTNHKIGKGSFFSLSDTLLTLTRASEPYYYVPMQVGNIKTRHAAGHNMAVSMIVCVSVGVILGAITAPSDDKFIHYSSGEGALGGALVGIPLGGIIGGFSMLLKRQPHLYTINGNAEQWRSFKTDLETKH